MFINGEWVDADGVYEIVNPATEEVVATAAKGTVEHADRAIAAARASFESGVWRDLPPAERSRIMVQIGARLTEELPALALLEAQANGATIRQAGNFHVALAIAHFNHFAELAGTYQFEEAQSEVVSPTLSANIIRKEPIGVCAGIVPWNFPLLLAVWKLGPGLAAGNSMVLKVDEKTPLTMLRFCEIAEECGLPAGVLNVITGEGPEVGARQASHPDVDKIAFTGSTEVGREIMRLASGTVKRVTLELGGKSPVIVLDDADVETAVDAALFGCWLYSGQACESGTRLLLPDRLHDEFVEKMIARAKTLKVGDIMDMATDVGPVISAVQRDRILGYIESARQEGATVAYTGEVDMDRGFWVHPTILTDVTNDMQVAQEEIFGPVLSVIRYTDDEDAVRIANDTIYGLAAAVWSADTQRALGIANRLRAGTVWVNDAHMINCALPFGGYKQSGVGRELGPRAIDAYVEEKNLHIDLSGRLDRRVYALLMSTPPSQDAG
jgi:acyl-CoA reductase-like NAD-dependent aldehyde dehydrogenase